MLPCSLSRSAVALASSGDTAAEFGSCGWAAAGGAPFTFEGPGVGSCSAAGAGGGADGGWSIRDVEGPAADGESAEAGAGVEFAFFAVFFFLVVMA